MITPWRIQLLGGLSAERNGREIVRFQSRKTGSLLGFLALNLHQSHPRDNLVERIWPDLAADKGRSCLSTSLYSLRMQLEPPDIPYGSVLLATRTEVRLNPETVSTDAAEFGALVHSAREEPEAAARLTPLLRACSLYRGDLVPGCAEDWVLTERERLEVTFIHVLQEVVKALEERGEIERALEYALQAVTAAPDREESYYEAIRLNRMLGRDLDAVRYYHQLVAMLDVEWGQQPSRATHTLVEGLPLGRSVGRRRYRGTVPLSRGPDSPPNDHDTSASPGPLNPSLPLTITRFFGRESELAYLCDLLRPAPGAPEHGRPWPERSRAPIVTLIGPGGSGKTRLAVEIMRRLAGAFAEHVTFVPLADITDPGAAGQEALCALILDALSASRSGGTPPSEQLVRAMTGRPHLLILDNAEHVNSACADLLWTLLRHLPLLTCLITSRMPLGLAGEHAYPVQPLPVPTRPGTPARLMEFASVQMFVDRAQAVRPDFQIIPHNAAAVAAVCQRLEGIPLAIELAAARATALTPIQMLEELSHRFDFLVSRYRHVETRHRTLHTAIDWSYQLLSAEAQRCFRTLSIFRGGWTLEAVRAVYPGPYALDYLEQLAQRSLITSEERAGRIRHRMLESLREYAEQQLVPDERCETQRRHAEYFLGLAEGLEPQLRGATAQTALEILDAEHDNLRAVLGAFQACDAGLRVAGALWRFWSVRGFADEGSRWLASTLANNANAPPSARAKALNGLGVLCQHLGDLPRASQTVGESMEISRRCGNTQGLAEALNIAAVIAGEQGHPNDARAHCMEAIALWRSLEDQWGIAGTLNNLARIEHGDGNLAEASRCYRESQAIYKKLGDWARAALVLSNLGAIAERQRDFPAARVAFEQSLELNRALGNRWGIAVTLYNLGEALYRECNHPDARSHLCESIRIRHELGDKAGMAFPLATLANIAARDGDYVRAARLHAAAGAIHEAFGTAVPPEDQDVYDDDVQAIRATLREQDFRAAWTYGREMTPEQALAEALEDPLVEDPIEYSPLRSALLPDY